MAGGLSDAELLGHLDTLYSVGTVTGLTDAELLERFVTGRDRTAEAAFAALVERHGAMVLRVCREVLGDPHDAQDAFQATFLVLVRRAGSVRERDSVASWLYGVALRVARRARADTAHRRRQERQAAAPSTVIPFEDSGEPLGRLEIHEEIARLPEKYRAAIVLCYLESQSTEAAAERLGCPKGTVLSRLSRGREQLRARLIRRGLAPTAGALGLVLCPKTTAAMPESLMFAALRCVAGPGAISAVSTRVAALAEGVLASMASTKLKAVGIGLLATALLATGAGVVAQHGAGAGAVDAARVLIRELESQTESQRDQLKKAEANLRRAQALLNNLEAEGTSRQTFRVRRLAEQLRQHPVTASASAERLRLYLLDVDRREATLIADAPDQGLTFCGSTGWSNDGGRILFDATPKVRWKDTRMKMFTLAEGRPALSDLGPGNCPTFSPDGRRIAFLLNPGAVPGAETGVWLMQADGSERRRLGGYGRPVWSPDSRQILIVGFANPNDPSELALMDIETGRERPLAIPGLRIFSIPSWADERTIVAVVCPDRSAGIALLDVTDPEQAKIKEVLWDRGEQTDFSLHYPIYSARTRHCVFVGQGPKGKALYEVPHGKVAGPPMRLEPEGYDSTIASLSYSPDGRYVLFCSDRPNRSPQGPAFGEAARGSGAPTVNQGDSRP
jgi:RNA polymerase sigma factor (sigma-70 family)